MMTTQTFIDAGTKFILQKKWKFTLSYGGNSCREIWVGIEPTFGWNQPLPDPIEYSLPAGTEMILFEVNLRSSNYFMKCSKRNMKCDDISKVILIITKTTDKNLVSHGKKHRIPATGQKHYGKLEVSLYDFNFANFSIKQPGNL